MLECDTMTVRIWIAGCGVAARAICQNWVMKGQCVSVSDTDFVYKMGRESGVCVTLINYPRFPSSAKSLHTDAEELANKLLHGLAQGSYTIQGPLGTFFHSRRGDT